MCSIYTHAVTNIIVSTYTLGVYLYNASDKIKIIYYTLNDTSELNNYYFVLQKKTNIFCVGSILTTI